MAIDRWEDAFAYDRFMGRWSRTLAQEFVRWLQVPPAASWLEIGCGTGALTTAICELGRPSSVLACDTASDFVTYCREHLRYPQLSVVTAEPGALPGPSTSFDVVVSSLVLNFLPAPLEALVQMRDACSPGGRVAACVWDYADGMEFLRIFWDAAAALNPAARPLHEGSRFPLCSPQKLRSAFQGAGLQSVIVEPITIATTFDNFADFWAPLVAGAGPAPTYVSTLTGSERQRLADRLQGILSDGTSSPIELHARAWAASGVRAGT